MCVVSSIPSEMYGIQKIVQKVKRTR